MDVEENWNEWEVEFFILHCQCNERIFLHAEEKTLIKEKKREWGRLYVNTKLVGRKFFSCMCVSTHTFSKDFLKY